MRVILVRHAEAVPHEDAGSDRDRWLSLRGREMARGLARLLREQSIEPDAIVASPLPRAVQTAELLAGGLDYLGAIASWRSLEPGAQPRPAAAALAASGAATIIVVSHEPTISTLGAFLAGIPAFPSFRTAQACVLDGTRPVFTARADVMTVAALFLD
jgi:phosphohistidine phosphatase